MNAITETVNNCEMRELNFNEIDEVNGGVLPVVAAFAAGLAFGFILGRA